MTAVAPHKTIEEYLAQAQHLPPAPQVLPQLLRLLGDLETDTREIVDLIALDPALTAKVLQACNSALLGAARPASDVADAIQRLGLQAVYRLVAVMNGARVLRPRRPVAGFDAADFWRHSVTAALAAQMIAEARCEDPGVLFTAALLHDLGKVILTTTWAEEYTALLDADTPGGEALAQREQIRYGLDHAILGGRLLAHWKFPAPIIAGVWHHHQPRAAAPFTRHAAIVHLADAVAHQLEAPPAEAGSAVTPALENALSLLALTPDSLLAIAQRTRENFDFVEALCRMSNS